MHSEETNRGCIAFTLWGIPTVIRPSAWIMLLILGSMRQPGAPDALQTTLIFMVAGMLCLLVHEYGHALMCRAMGGSGSSIEIVSLGGVTHSTNPPRTRMGRLLMVLAGPGATALCALLVGLVIGRYIHSAGAGISLSLLLPLSPLLPADVLQQPLYESLIALNEANMSGEISLFTIKCLFTMSNVCVWWSLLNMLPILPLDGGETVRLCTNNLLLTCRISIIVASLLLVVSIIQVALFSALLCGYFAYHNWQVLKAMQSMRHQ